PGGVRGSERVLGGDDVPSRGVRTPIAELVVLREHRSVGGARLEPLGREGVADDAIVIREHRVRSVAADEWVAEHVPPLAREAGLLCGADDLELLERGEVSPDPRSERRTDELT